MCVLITFPLQKCNHSSLSMSPQPSVNFLFLHPEWYSCNLLVIFLLPECASRVILWIWPLNNQNNWIVNYLESIIEIELKPRILNCFSPNVCLSYETIHDCICLISGSTNPPLHVVYWQRQRQWQSTTSISNGNWQLLFLPTEVWSGFVAMHCIDNENKVDEQQDRSAG